MNSKLEADLLLKYLDAVKYVEFYEQFNLLMEAVVKSMDELFKSIPVELWEKSEPEFRALITAVEAAQNYRTSHSPRYMPERKR